MNAIDRTKRAQLISVLVEGSSIRSTATMCDVVSNIVLKFVPEIGRVCADYQDKAFRTFRCKRV